MKIKFTVEVQEMSNGFLNWEFELFFTLFINNKKIFVDQDKNDSISKIGDLPYPKHIKEQIEDKMYESMHNSISKIYFSTDYQYNLSEVNV